MPSPTRDPRSATAPAAPSPAGSRAGSSAGPCAGPYAAPAAVLRVDRVLCTGHGVCASLLPEHLRLDEWGYPIVDHPQVDEREAGIAMTLCPARALWVDRPRGGG